jgi:hypothetical protein
MFSFRSRLKRSSISERMADLVDRRIRSFLLLPSPEAKERPHHPEGKCEGYWAFNQMPRPSSRGTPCFVCSLA